MAATDAQLLRRADRDAGAFVEFYDRHERALATFAGSMLRDPHVTVDVVAETFARAYEGRHGYRDVPGGGRAWLLGIARHVILAYWRQSKVERAACERLNLVSVPDESTIRQVEQAVLESEAAVVASWLSDLPPEQLEAVRRRVLRDEDYETIATDLSCSEPVVRQRVSRGLAALRNRPSEGP
jgi:RNA polymerase sigma factor (sigma-70 family)